jgi:hypothetical protein
MERFNSMTADGVILVAAAWLFASPWMLDYGDNAGWNSTTCAVVIAILALARMFALSRVPLLGQADWLTALIGLWLIASPWFLSGYSDTADKWSTVAVGVVVAVAATASEWIGMGERAQHRPAM